MNLCIAPAAFVKKVLKIIGTMQKLSCFSKDGAIVQSYANHVACIIDQHFAEKIRQATVRDCFPVRDHLRLEFRKKVLLKEETIALSKLLTFS